MEYLNLAVIAAFVPNLLAAVAILVVGWIVAAVVSSLIRGLLKRTSLDNRLARAIAGDRPHDPGAAAPPKVENGIAKAIYYVILIFVVVAALQALGLAVVAGPLNSFLTQVLAFVPRLIGAGVLIAIAWIVATLLRTIAARLLSAVRIDERVRDSADTAPAAGAQAERAAAAGSAGAPSAGGATTQAATAPASRAAAAVQQGTGRSLSKTLSDVVYWLVWLLFLPAILGALRLEGILAPVQTMLDRALGFLPNLIAAAVILVVGWFVARLVQRIVTGLLASVGVDRLADRVGVGAALGNQRLSSLLGLVIYILIFLPIVVAALNALQLDAVTQPVSNMLNDILGAIPNIFAAVLVLVIAFVVGRMVAGLVTNVLAGAGFDSLPVRLGLSRRAATPAIYTGAEAAAPGATTTPVTPPPALQSSPTGRRPSDFAGSLVLVAIMIFAAIEAAGFLGFTLLSELLAQFLVFGGHILAGLAVFAIALYLANLAADLVRSSGAPQSRMLALAARVCVVVLGGAMALRQMGLANEIINLAFGLLLGAVALASGLAFGLGGREVAGEELREWRDTIKSDPPNAGESAAPTDR